MRRRVAECVNHRARRCAVTAECAIRSFFKQLRNGTERTNLNCAISLHCKGVTRSQRRDSAVDGERVRNASPKEEADMACRFGCRVNVAAGEQCLDLRSEAYRPPVIGEVERLDTER